MKANYCTKITLHFSPILESEFQKDIDDKFQDFFSRVIADKTESPDETILCVLQSAFKNMKCNGSDAIIHIFEEDARANYPYIEDKFQKLFSDICDEIAEGKCVLSGAYEQETSDFLRMTFAFSDIQLEQQLWGYNYIK